MIVSKREAAIGLLGVLTAVSAAIGCGRASTTAAGPVRSPDAVTDSALFAAVLRRITADTLVFVTVDPRPLRPDPLLVTLHYFDVIPDRVDPEAQRNPFAPIDSALIRRRLNVLRSVGVPHADGLRDAGCPGIMLPRPPGSPRRASDACPAEGAYRSVVVAIPRRGGAYWPGNRDERAQYANREVYSVRVIERDLRPEGSVEVSSDYVFERGSGGVVVFLKQVRLLIVE
jgi:hypothetical protein